MKTISNIRKKVIVDTDMGWDDVLSISYLMKNPAIEIVGITVTGCGETNLRWGAVIAKTLMELGNQTNAKVCVGTDAPLALKHVFPQAFKDDMNDIMGLLGSLNPTVTIDIDNRPAWEFIVDTLNAEDDITILSLGGFTNLAKALERDPSAINKIKMVYAMAGAVYVDGNIALLNNAKPEWDQGPIYSTNHVAEWNVFVDPEAASKVFNSTIPLMLVPLDACNYVILDPGYIEKVIATDPIATLVKNIFKKKTGDSSEGVPVPIFDPLATVIMAGEMEYQWHSEYLKVITEDSEENNQCGKTSITLSGTRAITIVQGVSQKEFADKFAKVINSVRVDAKIKWQDSNIGIKKGDSISMKYLKGEQWTANPLTGCYDADGNSTIIAKEGYTLPQENEGALCGRIGETGGVFLIGNEKEGMIADNSGTLFLCINDDLDGRYGKGFADNEGAVSVSISISPAKVEEALC